MTAPTFPVRLARKTPGTYETRDGRYTVTQRFDSSAGRGARVPRGWAVKDNTTGHVTTHASLIRARESINRAIARQTEEETAAAR